jgi:serine/threonine-protein kinase
MADGKGLAVPAHDGQTQAWCPVTGAGAWARVKQLFQAALERNPDERAAFLREACGEDETLRADVQSLLDAHGEAGAFADRPAVEILGFSASLVKEGTQIGAYHIGARIGAGGMGEVFRAHDTTLRRDVAIKFLSPEFSLDPDGLARLEREARLLASLNHPNICAIYGVERSNDTLALVLELVEGPTLAERLAKRALPLRDALAIARQIAEALDAAHDKGIIHRDLKPANVKITPDGLVKVLDFGLAKEVAGDAAADLTQSPATTLGGRHEGVLLGTVAYMSPQQARGQLLDKRTDIWAFGCVLYEMLSGRRAFGGGTSSDAIAAVLEREPDWTALPATTPQSIRTLIERCLEKDLKRRLRDIGDARLEIDRAITMPSNEPPAHAALDRRRRALPWVLSGAIGVGAGLALAVVRPIRTVLPLPPVRVTADPGTDAPLLTNRYGGGTAAILSPDGGTLAFVAETRAGRPQLYVRRLGQLRATALAGTDGAVNPFFSPDGQWIAFFADSKLKKILTTGGGLSTLCDARDNRGGVWGEDGAIIFAPDRAGTGLWRVSSGGGTPEPLTTLDAGEVTERWPQVLPGGKGILYTGHNSPNGFTDANVVVQPLPHGTRKVLVREAYDGRYILSGHLIYIHDSTLFAAPFDLDRLEVTGPAVHALDGFSDSPAVGAAQVAVSRTGTLVYVPGPVFTFDAPIDWADRGDKVTPLRAAPAYWLNAVFSPDGRTLAMTIYDGKHYDNWVYDWGRDVLSRLTHDLGVATSPVWTPGGLRIVFSSTRDGQSVSNLYGQRADGTGDAQRLTNSNNAQTPASVHPGGKLIAFVERHPETLDDVMILPIEGDEASGWTPGTPTVFLNSRFSEYKPTFSPDGRWLAYVCNESGRDEVYVRPFPGPGGKSQISTGGGSDPTWSRVRPELFYGTPEQRIMVASYTAERDSFLADKPRLGSSVRFSSRTTGRNFDLHPDGERFALTADREQRHDDTHHVTLIFNFFDELRRLARTATP